MWAPHVDLMKTIKEKTFSPHLHMFFVLYFSCDLHVDPHLFGRVNYSELATSTKPVFCTVGGSNLTWFCKLGNKISRIMVQGCDLN